MVNRTERGKLLPELSERCGRAAMVGEGSCSSDGVRAVAGLEGWERPQLESRLSRDRVGTLSRLRVRAQK